MRLRLVPLILLAACGEIPKVDWPPGKPGPAPELLPIDELAVPGAPTLDQRGAALAAEAAALKARAAAIGQ